MTQLKYEPDETCPICRETPVERVRCAYEACAFSVVTCPRCDHPKVVAEFVADHQKDCAHGASHPARHARKFAAPHRAA